MKETLQRAMSNARLHEVDLATHLLVDPKTVARWLEGRLPHQVHRGRLSHLLGVDELDLWPELRKEGSRPLELTAVYPQRRLIPQNTWREFFAAAAHEINILAYSADFLLRDPSILEVLADKGNDGIKVQVALGDSKSLDLTRIGAEEDDSEVLSELMAEAVERIRPLARSGHLELRLHDAVLYNSIYRVDNEALVNQHVYGVPAAHAPAYHLHKTSHGGMFEFYLDSFDRIWDEAEAADG